MGRYTASPTAELKLHACQSLPDIGLAPADVWPGDKEARQAINTDVPLRSGCTDQKYKSKLVQALDRAFEQFAQPDLVVHNAGSDILDGDPLGRCDVDRRCWFDRTYYATNLSSDVHEHTFAALATRHTSDALPPTPNAHHDALFIK